MKKLLLYLQNHQTTIAGLLLFIVSIGVVVYLSPREIEFKYEFQKGKPWLYDNLVAPFDYPILKSEEALNEERDYVRRNKTLFLEKRSNIAENALVNFESDFQGKWRSLMLGDEGWDSTYEETLYLKARPDLKEELLNMGRDLLGSVFNTGILRPLEQDQMEYGEVMLAQNRVNSIIQLSDLLSIKEASAKVREEADKWKITGAREFLVPLILDRLEHNVFYNQNLTQKLLDSQLNNILPTRNKVLEGELIIFKGNIVDDEKFAKLRSLRQAYEGEFASKANFIYVLLGRILQVGLLFSLLYIFLRQYRPQLMEDIGKLTFVLVNILIMVGLVRVVLDFGVEYIWLVPLPILPMTIRSFFDIRLAMFLHTITVLLCGFFVSNSFVFIFLEFVAGIFAVVMVSNLYKRSQLFLTAAKIILVYCIAYLSVAIVQEGSLENINKLNFAFFAGNGFLTLMSFPLIYFQEKIFGLVSDVSLLELSDTNNPLLRELSQKAPGTFQHSLQVANLAEAAILAIHGNALLVRTGALYHDIGKLSNPLYFIENQTTGLNPHDELSFEESAGIIISHVKDGIKMAKKNNLPDVLIDFIRTHHGTSTVMYFYRQYIKNFPEEEQDLDKFSYPGPKPFSKETAALMMADSVEAASRSLNKPDHEKIDKLVENIIDHQLHTGQFNNANITMKDIRTIKKIFKKMLMNIYHVRIQYPE